MAKPPKMPKSLGLCVDKYREARDKRLEIEKQAKQAKELESAYYQHILDNIPKGDGGVVGKKFKAIRVDKTQYGIGDDTEFYAFVKKTGSFDILNRAINQKAVSDRLSDEKFLKKYPKGIPGVAKTNILTLSVTKV